MKRCNRLSKILAAAGVASRRACEKLIFDGTVTVNGEIIKIPQTQVQLGKDEIKVAGKKIAYAEEKVYFLLNKPVGYVCSNALNTGNVQTKLVIELFEEENKRLFTVGRLDKETTGLIIVTNDGHFANKVIHPSSHIKKEYIAKTDKEISEEHLKAINEGIWLQGSKIRPVSVKKVRKGTLKVVIMEGKKREVRLLLEAAGLETLSLSRIRIGGLVLGNLPIGAWRPMSESDKKAIFQ